MIRSRAFRWLMVLAGCFVFLLVWAMLFETQLVYPAPRGGNSVAVDYGAEDVSIRSADGTGLHAWYFDQADANNTLVFFHGNAESVETSGPWIGGLAASLNARVLILDYRGYGKSEGRPYERGIVQDGIAAVEWLSQRTGKPASQFIYLGRSLGGGVAIQVARTHPPGAFILVSNFSSMVDVAAHAFPWLPVRSLMRNRYESAPALAEMDIPLLQIHGERDGIIPIELGRRLFDVAPCANKHFLIAKGRGHNDLLLEDYLPEMLGFMDSL